jgi:hypothetical protein
MLLPSLGTVASLVGFSVIDKIGVEAHPWGMDKIAAIIWICAAATAAFAPMWSPPFIAAMIGFLLYWTLIARR